MMMIITYRGFSAYPQWESLSRSTEVPYAPSFDAVYLFEVSQFEAGRTVNSACNSGILALFHWIR